MSILCRLFGHKATGYRGYGPAYGRAEFWTLDGMGIEHWQLRCLCDRCDTRFVVGAFHAPLCPPEHVAKTGAAVRADLASRHRNLREDIAIRQQGAL